ncbi:MAG: D-sedoheptulose-7-phosphate isomerase [Bacteroidales bacterium]|jgi:D-sedoheptulose 7-phosphate isomerase
MKSKVKDIIKSSVEVKNLVLASDKLHTVISNVTAEIINCYKNGGKVLFCGNGGSAADAQHLAAELSGRFYFDRPPLSAEALHVNTSYLTAVANDYSYNEVYSRMVKAVGKKGDIIVGISTSGNSANVVNAFKEANKLGMTCVALTGESGGEMKSHCKHLINVPSSDTPRIQEAHILIGHIICQLVEEELFANIRK